MSNNQSDKLTKMSTDDSFEYIGMWKLSSCSNMTCGRISYNHNDGIKLHVMIIGNYLYSGLKESSTESHNNTPKPERIHGILETGENVLLDGCVKFKSMSMQYMKKSTYRVARMFVGEKKPSEDLKFDKMLIRYASLYTWLAPKTIDVKPSDKRMLEKLKFIFTPPKDIEVDLSDGLSLQISYRYSMSFSTTEKDFTIPQDVFVVLVSKKALSVGNLYEKINYFRNFLMLATNTTIQEKSIEVAKKDSFVTAFLNYKIYDDVAYTQDIFKMNFLYSEIKKSFDNVTREWFKFSDKYKKSINLYFRTLLERKHFTVEIEFLRVYQSLEVFHKIKFPDKQFRIRDLLKHTKDLLDLDTDCDDFISKVVTVRDYYSHGYLKHKEKELPPWREIAQMMNRLHLLMFSCILKEMKIPKRLKIRIMKKKITEVQATRWLTI